MVTHQQTSGGKEVGQEVRDEDKKREGKMSVVGDRVKIGRIAGVQTAMGQIYRYGVRLWKEDGAK